MHDIVKSTLYPTGFKTRVENQKQAKKIQKLCFDLGIYWKSGDKEVNYLGDIKYLYITENKYTDGLFQLTYDEIDSFSFYSDNPADEIDADELISLLKELKKVVKKVNIVNKELKPFIKTTVENKKQAKKIQKLVFKVGGRWKSGDKRVQLLDEIKYLYIKSICGIPVLTYNEYNEYYDYKSMTSYTEIEPEELIKELKRIVKLIKKENK